ncbi:UNVERIFIED_CONTAM: hypothetical protein Sindi_2670100, partial [Sesamum indicum]
MRIVLDFVNQDYILDKPLSMALPKGPSPEEHVTFEKWLEDNHKVRSIILASMPSDIQKQYDRLDIVLSIMLHMKEVYAVPNKHIIYTATKVFSRTKMAEGSSVQSHGVKMLSLVEKLKDLKVGLHNGTYIDVYVGGIRRRGFNLHSERQEGRKVEEEEGQGKSYRNHYLKVTRKMRLDWPGNGQPNA